ncbi:MAG: Hsp20/alpha crystallin family protein [Spirochaetes bacterium]|nr:Hsp20/alpha crystallin family protein [Spirochaetota bacterium]
MSTDVKKRENIENSSYVVPTVDIRETENEYVLFADMPGVGKDGVEIVIANEELEIKGKVDANILEDEKSALLREFKMDDYYRKFTVGNNIDSEKVQAKMSNGVLELILPKKEELKPRKIEISAE